jgi:hypothetical protein
MRGAAIIAAHFLSVLVSNAKKTLPASGRKPDSLRLVDPLTGI